MPPTGVPGAVSNQPPQTAAAPVNGAAPVLQAANAENSNILTIPGSKRESVTNYEVDKTIKVTRSSTGTIKRMTAAVVVNYLPGATAEGTVVPQALTEAQQAQMLALVRETIGYNAERGDSVNLMNAQFQQDTGRLASDLPLWQQPETIALAKSVMWPVGLVLAALILALGVVRPILKARKKKEQAQLDLLAADEIERPALAAPLKPGEPTPEDLRLQQARALAKQNPIAVANIVKTWVNGEAN